MTPQRFGNHTDSQLLSRSCLCVRRLSICPVFMKTKTSTSSDSSSGSCFCWKWGRRQSTSDREEPVRQHDHPEDNDTSAETDEVHKATLSMDHQAEIASRQQSPRTWNRSPQNWQKKQESNARWAWSSMDVWDRWVQLLMLHQSRGQMSIFNLSEEDFPLSNTCSL